MQQSIHSILRRTITTSRCFSEMIGKPDKVSNIRPLKCRTSPSATEMEIRLNNLRNETQVWHHDFWYNHNTKFKKTKAEFIEKYFKENNLTQLNEDGTKRVLDPEVMAIFHKKFQDENNNQNLQYDKEWRNKNREILLLMLRVRVEKTINRVRTIFR